MADVPSEDTNADRQVSGETTAGGESPCSTKPSVSAALDALDEDDNAVRSTVVLMLGESLHDPSPLFDLARAIEDAAWRLFAAGTVGGQDPDNGKRASSTRYRAKARVLVANMRRNVRLRNLVLSGALAPTKLVAMTPDELATDGLREMRTEMNEKATRRRTRSTGVGDAIETKKYRCDDCASAGAEKLNNCAYFNLQNHRDVRKNETWGSKDSQQDDGRVLVRCLECNAEWNEATL